jgi:hypothetical protein
MRFIFVYKIGCETFFLNKKKKEKRLVLQPWRDWKLVESVQQCWKRSQKWPSEFHPCFEWMVLNHPNSFRFTYKRHQLRISYTTTLIIINIWRFCLVIDQHMVLLTWGFHILLLIIIKIWRFCLVIDQHMVLLTCTMIVILNSIFTIENMFGQNIRYHLDNLGHHPQFKYLQLKIGLAKTLDTILIT